MASSSSIHDDIKSLSITGMHSASPYTSTDGSAQRQVESQFHAPYHHERSHAKSSTTDDVQHATHRSLDRELTIPSSRRPSKPYAFTAATPPTLDTQPDSAISAHLSYTHNTRRQDVSRNFVNASAPHQSQSSTGHRNVFPPTPLESPLSRFQSDLNHDPLKTNQSRPRTPTQVFPLLPDLAAHYGIPQLLPPAPRTTPRRQSESLPNPQQDFSQICSNYLTMLSQPPNVMNDDLHVAVTPADIFPPITEGAAQAFYEALTASPDFSPEVPLSDFLTSPWDDSPFDDVLRTPGLGSSDMDMLTTPLLDDNSGGDSIAALFPDMPIYDAVSKDPPASSNEPFNVEGMFRIPASPTSPSLDPSSLYSSPRLPTFLDQPEHSSDGRRKSSATGTRKNITPESLVPLDAPTQPRKYTTPSSTSRKELPVVFAKKRSRSQAFGDDDGDQCEDPLPPNATEKEQIEWKRRQNTLAARKSRKRKLLYQMELETAIEQLTLEKETWKARALMYQSMLKMGGLEVPDFA